MSAPLDEVILPGVQERVNLQAIRLDRTRKASYTVVARYAAACVSVVVSLLTVPLCMNYLGTERYGIWLVISSIVAYLNVGDLGVGLSLLNRVAEARGKRGRESVGALLSTSFSLMVFVGLVVALLSLTIVWSAAVSKWFHVFSAELDGELRWTLTVVALAFAFLLPGRMIDSAQSGYQEGYFGRLYDAASSVMGLLALLMVIAAKGDMTDLALATFLLVQLANVANWWHFFRRHPEARLSWHKIDLKLAPLLLGLGWQFFLLQLYSLVILQTDNLVIAIRMGAESVVPYALAFLLIRLSHNLLGSIQLSLWPAYSEAQARGDWEWVEAAYRRTTILTVLLAGAATVLVLCWGQAFIRLWAGPKAQGSLWLMAGMSLYITTGQWTHSNVIMLNSMNQPSVQLWSGLCEAALNLGLSLALIGVWGLAGVAWGTSLANLLVSCWFLPWSVWRVTQKRLGPAWVETLRVCLPPIGIGVLVGLGLSRLLPPQWPAVVRAPLGASLTALAYGGSAYLLAPALWRNELEHQGKKFSAGFSGCLKSLALPVGGGR